MIWDVSSDVQDFVDETETNYGWKITDENYWGSVNIPVTSFHSKEYGSFIPYLEIETTSINDWDYYRIINFICRIKIPFH